MNWIGRATIALASVLVVASAPAVASIAATAGTPRIATEAQAQRILERRGLSDVRGLEEVGDYWEGEALDDSKPVVAYLFENGTLEIGHYPLAELKQAFGGPARIGVTSELCCALRTAQSLR